MARDQVVNNRLIEAKSKKVNLDNDPVVKKQLEMAKKQIVQQVFIQKEIEKAMTDERLKVAYEQYVTNFPEITERKTAHILVKEKSQAEELINKINEGEDFGAIAKEHSIDATKDNNGIS